MKFKEKINTWIFDLDNTLYSADSGIFQQVHQLMGEFISKNLNMDMSDAKKLQSKYYKQHGTTLRGLMDNHGIDPDHFLDEVHRLDYSIVGSNKTLNEELHKLEGRKIIYTNANKKHVIDVLDRIDLSNFFDEIFDIKMANYIPKPELAPYQQIIDLFTINPCKVINIEPNLIMEKKLAELNIIDPNIEWEFKSSSIKSKSSNSPFIGDKLVGKVMMTINKGFYIKNF